MADGGIRTIVQGVEVEFLTWVDYFADLRLGGLTDIVRITDDVTREAIYVRAFADGVTVGDTLWFSYTQEYNRFVADSVVMDDVVTLVSDLPRGHSLTTSPSPTI